MSYPQGQLPPYQQPYNLPPSPPKQSGMSTGLKLAIGGCLMLVVLGGGFLAACGVWIREVSKELKDSNLSHTSDESVPSSSIDTKSQRTLTLEKYNRITNGMSQQEVETILESKGKQISEPTTNNDSRVIYVWQEGDTATVSRIQITFVHEKVHDKTQLGLQ
jgi:hypothetical protein